MFFVYTIFNKKHRKIYIGQTENLEQRLKIHNEGKFYNSYTSRFDGEWVLIYSEGAISRTSALSREKQLKSSRGRAFLKQFIPM